MASPSVVVNPDRDDGVFSLKDLLRIPRYIPQFQRGYSWQCEGLKDDDENCNQCKDLIEDLEDFISRKVDNSKYSFGQIVCYLGQDEKRYIVDGQQRITTVNLFLGAMSCLCKRIYKECDLESADQLRSYINSILLEQDYYLNVYKTSRAIFTSCMGGSYETVRDLEINSTTENIRNNFIYFYEYFCAKINIVKNDMGVYPSEQYRKQDDDIVQLKTLAVNLCDFKVCSIYCHTIVDAFKTFETVNNRGLKLTNMDIIKNHIFSVCYSDEKSLNEDIYNIENNWGSFYKEWSQSKFNAGEIDKYLMHYLRATDGHTSNKSVLGRLKDIIIDAPSAVRFIQSFTTSMELFRLMYQKGFSTDSIDDETLRIFNGFRKIKYKTICPALLSPFLRFRDDPELPKIMREVTRAVDRLLVLGQFIEPSFTKENDAEVSKKASRFYKDPNYSLAEYISDLNNLQQSSDTVLLEKVKTMPWADGNNNDRARYVLSELYNRDPDTTTIVSLEKVHLEHILPTSPSHIAKNWPQFNSDEHDEYYPRLGNLLLLNSKLNSDIKDSSYEDKRKFAYEKTGAFADINGVLFMDTPSKNWMKADIETRSTFLAQKIIETWAARPYEVE